MAQTILCPHCGVQLPANAPAGHCPACLLRIGLALADGGLAFGLNERSPIADPGDSHASSTPERIRYVGDYELLEEIAHGGMGVVYRARQVSLNRPVALKMIRLGEFANETEVARFRAEAEAAARLDHPNIVPIYEVGEHEGRHYFSMKLLEGGALSGRISNPQSQIRNREIAVLVATAARAVHYAHQRGIIHRDLKPGNILLDARRQPHVTDFGLAKRIETDSSMTTSGAIVGTPSYIAPEQAAGAKVLTTAADVYSLGAIIYELLAGRPPFVGATVMATLQKVMSEEPVPPSMVRGSRRKEAHVDSEMDHSLLAMAATRVDRDLETICLKCLEKDPARRYGSAEALAEDLERWLAHEPIRARTATPIERIFKWTRRNPLFAGALVAVAAVTLLGIAGITWQWRQALAARGEAQRNAEVAIQELRKTQLAQLQMVVGSRRQGHRLESLRIIQTLASNKPSADLRNLAITALASTDAKQLTPWRIPPLEPSCPPALDGRFARVVLGDTSGALRVCSYPDFRELGALQVVGSAAVLIEWVNHDQWLAAILADGRIVLWDVASGRIVFEAGGCHGPGQSHRLAVDADGRFLVMSGTNRLLRAFDLATRRELPAVQLPAPAEALAFDSTGAKLAVSLLDHFQVREFPSLHLLTDDPAPGYYANEVVWEPHDRWVFAALQGWNVMRLHPGLGREGQILGTAHDAAAVSLHRNRPGTLLASFGTDNTSYLWNPRFPFSVVTLPRVAILRFAAEGHRFAGWNPGQGLATFEAVPSRETRNLVGNPPHTLQLRSCYRHPSRPLVAAASHVHAAVFDLDVEEDRVDLELSGCGGAILSDDGETLFTVSYAGVQAWPIERPDDSPARKWGLAQPRLVAALGTNFLPQLTGDIAGGGRFVAAGSSRTVVVDLRSAGVLRELPAPERSSFPAVARDGSWWAQSQLAPESTWLGTADAAKLRKLSAAGGRVAVSPDESLLAVAGTTRIECFDTRSWQLLWSVPVELTSQASGPCSFSSSGRWLGVSVSSHDVVLLHAFSGRALARFKTPSPPLVFGVSFNRDDTQLVTSTMQGLFVWDLTLVRRELAGLGLDWPDDSPAAFAPRR